MKKIFVLAYFIIASITAICQGSWQQKNNLPSNGRYASFAFSIGSYGYVGGGQINTSGTYVSDFWEYNSEGVWTQKANYAGGIRYSASAFTIGNYGYVCCGYDGQCKKDLWMYDPSNNTWIQKSNLPSSGRYGAFSFAIGDKAYLGMGSIGGPPFLNDFWEYNSTNDTWTQKTSYNNSVGRIHGIGFSINGYGYAGLGTDNGNGHYVDDFWQYNPQTNQWILKANYPVSKANTCYFVINDKAYVGGGINNNGVYDNLYYEYSPINNIWSAISSPGAINRSAGIGFSINNSGYIGLGISSNGSFLNDLWQYTPQNSSIGNSDNSSLIDIKYYNKELQIKSNFNNAQLLIYNIAGVQIIKENIKNTATISLSTLSKGTYLYKVINNKKIISTDKFIVL